MGSNQEDSESIEFKASHIRTPNKDVVGGKLHLAEDKLIFKPNDIAGMAGEGKLRIPLYKITEVRKESAGRGIIYSLTNGWLAGHLHIMLNDDTEYVFTVSSVDEKIETLTPIIKSASEPDLDTHDRSAPEPDSDIPDSEDTDETERISGYCSSCGKEVSASMEYCPDCGEGLDEREITQEIEPDDETDSSARFPILSIFSSLMLFRGGAISLETAGGESVPISFLFFVLGISVIPRVRVFIYSRILSKFGVDMSKRLWSIGIALIYTLFVTVSSLFLIGEGGFIGLASLILALVLSAIIVLISRVVNRLF